MVDHHARIGATLYSPWTTLTRRPSNSPFADIDYSFPTTASMVALSAATVKGFAR